MIPFLSSTLLDLVKEREAVLRALRKMRLVTQAMEDFLAMPFRPSETALSNLRQSDVVLLVIGFKAGSLLPDGSGSTYTSIEYDEALRLGKEPLVFIKTEKEPEKDLGSWKNEELDPEKREALNRFRSEVSSRWTPAYFDSPDGLALEVVLALEAWQERGRPGARKTFASIAEFFQGKNAAGHFRLLDFDTTLLGRNEVFTSLNAFATDKSQRVGIVSGRGGIGKSKLLHDWAVDRGTEVLFLKDEPLWVDDPEKEVPTDCQQIIVDDAHRQASLKRVLQLLHDTSNHRNLQLILSTRPGSAAHLLQEVCRRVDRSQVTEFPELKELSRSESRALAEQVLGPDYSNYAPLLADIASNSPLVIVAGGRLLASGRIDPSTLTTNQDFRSTIFNHLLQEFDLRGPQFPIDPPLPLLYLIAALGPVDMENPEFQTAAQEMFGKPIDDILSTVDQLALVGVITPRPNPVRIIPDVLADYLLEDHSVTPQNVSKKYADRVYQFFGAHSLKNLMRNFAELDWRRGRSIEITLRLLDSIWADIHSRFRTGDEYVRHTILTEIAGAAIYQPDHVIALVRFAMNNPVVLEPEDRGSIFRLGQEHVVSAVPHLLEATAHHPDRRRESIDLLWELSHDKGKNGSGATSAEKVLKHLSAWHRYGDPNLNFAMLLEAVRLIRRPDALSTSFTPFALISQLLEREGEFNEWQDEKTMSFGGFGLNYAAVGPVRQNAIDFLEFAIYQSDELAIKAIAQLESTLHNFLNRVGRPSTQHELDWQRSERERCLNILRSRFEQPSSALLRARIYDALRSVTAINCPDYVRSTAQAILAEATLDDSVRVVDAICTADHQLPLLTTEFSDARWEEPIQEVMQRGRSGLERLAQDTTAQARFTIDQTRACLDLHLEVGGFHRFMLTFQDRPDFLEEVTDQLTPAVSSGQLVGQLSSVLAALHVSSPSAFRDRALASLSAGAEQAIHAAANNLRVFEHATERDVSLIQAYAGYPDPVAKRGAIFAIAYMGKFTELRQSLKAAAVSIRSEGNARVAADLADAFGPYGVPLTLLTRDEAVIVAEQFLLVHDWTYDQGAIPRFLSRFVALFPDETFDLLLRRIELDREARARLSHL